MAVRSRGLAVAPAGPVRPPGLPSACDLLGLFGADGAVDSAHHGLVACFGHRLARHHLDQWLAEDISRDPCTGDHFAAATKRTIDALNAVRVRLIEQIDIGVVAHVPRNPAAPLHTETVGSVIDRLAVAWVRSSRLAVLAQDEPTQEARSRARRASRQLVELSAAYDQLVRELRVGIRRVPRWQALKQYGKSR